MFSSLSTVGDWAGIFLSLAFLFLFNYHDAIVHGKLKNKCNFVRGADAKASLVVSLFGSWCQNLFLTIDESLEPVANGYVVRN